MKVSRASKRYAAALLSLADEVKKVDSVGADMQLVSQTITSSRELYLFFSSPVIDRAKKRSVVQSLYEGRVDKLTIGFLYLLVEKGREALTEAIAIEYGRLLDEKMGVVNAELKAPYKLDEKASSHVRSKLESLTGKKVRVSFSLDKGLIGGFQAQIGDTVYDGSVRRQLEILKRQLSENGGLNASLSEQNKRN